MLSISNEHPELETFFPNRAGRRHWKRVLLSPLYHPIHIVIQTAMKMFDKNNGPTLGNHTIEQKVAHFKLKGNDYFKKQDWCNAIKSYQSGIIDYVQSSIKRNFDDDQNSSGENKREEKEVKNWKQFDLDIVASYSNIALCRLKTGDFAEAVIASERAVNHVENYLENDDLKDIKTLPTAKWIDLKFKSLYRLTVALKMLRLFDKATATIKLANLYAPSSDTLCEKELADIEERSQN